MDARVDVQLRPAGVGTGRVTVNSNPAKSADDGAVGQRADARRNKQALLDAAAKVFVAAGVDAPVRAIAAEAGVGMGTIYRHFPTRADLIIAVYRHQIDALADSGATLLRTRRNPYHALAQWLDLFVDLLVTKHGLAAVLQSDKAGFDALHEFFLQRLLPACTDLLDAAVAARKIRDDVSAYELMRAIGNLCIGSDADTDYDARRMVGVLIDGLESRPVA